MLSDHLSFLLDAVPAVQVVWLVIALASYRRRSIS